MLKSRSKGWFGWGKTSIRRTWSKGVPLPTMLLLLQLFQLDCQLLEYDEMVEWKHMETSSTRWHMANPDWQSMDKEDLGGAEAVTVADFMDSISDQVRVRGVSTMKASRVRKKYMFHRSSQCRAHQRGGWFSQQSLCSIYRTGNRSRLGASYLEKTQGELVEGWSTMMASEDDYCWRRSLPSKETNWVTNTLFLRSLGIMRAEWLENGLVLCYIG